MPSKWKSNFILVSILSFSVNSSFLRRAKDEGGEVRRVELGCSEGGTHTFVCRKNPRLSLASSLIHYDFFLFFQIRHPRVREEVSVDGGKKSLRVTKKIDEFFLCVGKKVVSRIFFLYGIGKTVLIFG